MKNTSRMFTRWAAVAATLITAAAVILFGLNQSSQAGGDTKPYICHPVNGNGNTGNGWDLIGPDEASSHIDESLYPDGVYWKHMSADGRHDVYASGQTCPDGGGETGGPTATVTVTGPTATTTVTATPNPTGGPTAPGPGICPTQIRAFILVFGTRHADNLQGTVCRDIIHAGNGNDRLYGLDGSDILLGGRGRDHLFAGPGLRDNLRGGLNRDVCVGTHRDKYISCERIRYTD